MSKALKLGSFVGFVSENKKNTRDAIPNLSRMNYCVFESELTGENDDRVPLVRLARSADEKERDLFVSLLKENESSIYGLKDTFLSIGQHQPVLAASTPEGAVLIDGCRRFLARCIALIELGGSNYDDCNADSIPVVLKESDAEKGEVISAVVNLHHKPPAFSDEAMLYHKYKQAGFTIKAIAEKFGLDKDRVVNENGKKTTMTAGQQRVANLVKIVSGCLKGTGGASMDELRKVDTGVVAYTKLLKKISEAKKGGGSKNGSSGEEEDGETIDTNRATNRNRVMTLAQAKAAVNDMEALTKYCEEHDLDLESVRHGMFLVMRADYEPAPVEEAAVSE